MELSILALLLVLVAAWLGGTLISRIGYPAVLGELLAGIVLGPALFGLLGDGAWLSIELGIDGAYKTLDVVGHLGVLLMMLYIGMEIDPKELGKASWTGFLASIGGFVMPFFLGLGAVVLMGGTLIEGLFVAIALGVTSLAVNSRIVVDLRILDTRIAHVMLAGALIADTLCLLVFAGLLPFAQMGDVDMGAVGGMAFKALSFFIGVGVLGLWVFPFITRFLRKRGITSLSVYFTLLLLIALLFGELAEMAGLHAILGTFAAGLFLREGMLDPKKTHELNELVRIVSVAFLAPIFFVLTGFHVSFDVFQTDLLLLILVLLAAVIGKIVGTALFYLPTGHGWREGLVIGAGMNGRGAVEIILAQIGYSLGLISLEIFSILVFMAIATTATVPLFLKWGTNWLHKRNALVRSADKRNGVLIIGATRTARAMARLLGETRPVWLVDSNPVRVEDATREGLDAVAGNALENEVLARAKAPEAGIAIAMTGNAEINALAVRHLREVFMVPSLYVLVLGKDRSADTQTFAHLDASMLFAQAVPLSDWDHWFSRDQVSLERISAPGTTSADVLRAVTGNGPVLPLAIEREHEGARKVLPFTSGMELRPEDKVVLARARVAQQPASDRFDELVKNCPLLDVDAELDREAFFAKASAALANVVSESAQQLNDALHQRETLSSTMLTPGLAVPHILLEGEGRFALLVARVKGGVQLTDEDERANALFVMAATPDQRNFHLKALSAIAQIWQSPDFEARWRGAKTQDELRSLLLNAPRQRTA